MKNEYFHIKVEKSSSKYKPFVTSKGQYEFYVAILWLCLSPTVFMRHVAHVFRDMVQTRKVRLFVDDVIIIAEDKEEEIIIFQEMLQTAEKFG